MQAIPRLAAGRLVQILLLANPFASMVGGEGLGYQYALVNICLWWAFEPFGPAITHLILKVTLVKFLARRNNVVLKFITTYQYMFLKAHELSEGRVPPVL